MVEDRIDDLILFSSLCNEGGRSPAQVVFLWLECGRRMLPKIKNPRLQRRGLAMILNRIFERGIFSS
jgi:hypothetical protein